MVLSNGNLCVCTDKFGQVRDFYYPHVGLENHIGSNQLHKIGVFVDGAIEWLDNGNWEINIDYENNSMISKIYAVNKNHSISLNFSDIVYNEKNIFVRKIILNNNSRNQRKLKIFLNQQFKISDTNHADTAYFSSSIESIIHYKGRRVFLVGGVLDDKPFDDYSIGFCGIEGKEGTWKDAEDGVLSKNTIEHGVVDSVISWQREVPANSSITVYYWILASETYRQVCELLGYLLNKGPEHILESTHDFWKAWVDQVSVNKFSLSLKANDLFKNSLLVMRAHCDNFGGILASVDSGNIQYGGDTYGYVWPRDGSFSAWSLDLAGFYDVSRKFYLFMNDVLTDDGYVLHKYQPDRSLGSSWHPWVKDGKRQLAIQEDETAIILVGLWEHYIRSKDLEFVEGLYNSLIKKTADFMIRYKDSKTGLPLPSYDLWEEKYGVSSFTASVVYGALVSAKNFAKTLGKDEDVLRFGTEADSMRKSIINNLWDEKEKRFFNLVEGPEGLSVDKNWDASSFYGVFRFGVMAPDDPRMKETFQFLKQRLSKGINIGGFARYENDAYSKVLESSAGNPWFLTTLWFVQYKIAIASNLKEMEEIKVDLEWVAKYANGSMLSEQLNPNNGQPISASPLVWSHSEYVRTLIEYNNKIEYLNSKKY